MYTAIVLYPYAQNKLRQWGRAFLYLNGMSDLDWKFYAHHSTICMGKLPDDVSSELGKEINLEITHTGIDDDIFAVKVNGNYLRRDGTPHITIATNLETNATPVMSNNIKEWYELPIKITILGIIKELQ